MAPFRSQSMRNMMYSQLTPCEESDSLSKCEAINCRKNESRIMRKIGLTILVCSLFLNGCLLALFLLHPENIDASEPGNKSLNMTSFIHAKIISETLNASNSLVTEKVDADDLDLGLDKASANYEKLKYLRNGNAERQDHPTLHSCKLTHVVMPFHVRQIGAVEANLASWTKFRPVLPADSTGNDSLLHNEPEIYFVFYSSANASDPSQKKAIAELERKIHGFWKLLELNAGEHQSKKENIQINGNLDTIPRKRVVAGFSGYQILHANLTKSEDHYLSGSRIMLEKMISKELSFSGPPVSYVMYMEPDCLPVASAWLTTLYQQTAWPILPFWIKGSMFRGGNRRVGLSRKPEVLFHINGNALYHIGDPGFRDFYFHIYKPWILSRSHGKERSFDTLLFFFLTDPFNFNIAKTIVHLFQYTDIIQNFWQSSYSVSQLAKAYPNTVLVHGGFRSD